MNCCEQILDFQGTHRYISHILNLSKIRPKKLTQQPSQQKKTATYAKWLGFGTEFGGVIAVFCYIGYRIDEAYNTSPYFLLAGFFISVVGMLYLTIKQTLGNRENDKTK